MELKTFAELISPDRRSLSFTPLGLSTAGQLLAEDALEYQQQSVAQAELANQVPSSVRASFERLRDLHAYGVLFYDAFTIAESTAWLVLEQALRERFVSFHEGEIVFVNAELNLEETIRVDDFDRVFEEVSYGGKYSKGWKIRLAADGSLMTFRGGLTHLLEWARKERLFRGQRNRRLEKMYPRLRNAVAHPGYRLSMPPESVRAIRDVAELINALWGQRTIGGRLYPAPIQREPMVVAWSPDSAGGTLSTMSASHLVTNPLPDHWSCVVLIAVPSDDLWSFDTSYESTTYPSELLWGPGPSSEAAAWLSSSLPSNDHVDYIDRLFASRTGVNDLPLRPGLALLELQNSGDVEPWELVRADFPADARAHFRHLASGESCGPRQSLPSCPVETVFEGTGSELRELLRGLGELATPRSGAVVHVPSHEELRSMSAD